MAANTKARQYQYGSAAVRMREIEDPNLRRVRRGGHHRGVSIWYVFFVSAALIFTANDATYSRINSNMDLEEIRDKAINELGMVYAREGQIETFTSENGDYVRQLSQIGE